MSVRITLATSKRVLKQLSHDPLTLGMILAVPSILLVILYYTFDKEKGMFNGLAPMMIGILPLIIMFLISSVATLRERTSGTLDRLMTQPISKSDFIFGYAIAFSLLGLIQALITGLVALGLLGVTVMGGTIPVILVAIGAAFLGTSLGLFTSAFARNEFQAVQFEMPVLMPQILLCGLFVARAQMAEPLRLFSNVLPLTYSVDAMQRITSVTGWSSTLTRDMIIIIGFGFASLILASVTIRRQE